MIIFPQSKSMTEYLFIYYLPCVWFGFGFDYAIIHIVKPFWFELKEILRTLLSFFCNRISCISIFKIIFFPLFMDINLDNCFGYCSFGTHLHNRRARYSYIIYQCLLFKVGKRISLHYWLKIERLPRQFVMK